MPFPHTLSQSLSPAKGAGIRPGAPALSASSDMSGPGQAPLYYGAQSPAGAPSCHPIFAAETEAPQNHPMSGSMLATPQQQQQRMLPGAQDASSVEAKPFFRASPSPQPLMENHFSTPQQHPPMMSVHKPEEPHMPGSSGSAFVQVHPSCHARSPQYPLQPGQPGQMPQYQYPSGPAYSFRAPHLAAGPSPPTYTHMHPAAPSHHLSQPPPHQQHLSAPSSASMHSASIGFQSMLNHSPSPAVDSLASPPSGSLMQSGPTAHSQPSPLTHTGSSPQLALAPQSLASPPSVLNSIQANPHPIVGTPEPTSERSRSIVTSSNELRNGVSSSRKRGAFGITASAEDGYSWLKYGEKRLTSARRTRAYFRCSKSKECDCPAKKFIDLLEEGGEGSNAMITYIQTHNHDKDPRRQMAAPAQADPLKSGTATSRHSHNNSHIQIHETSKPKGASACSPLQTGSTAGQGIMPKPIMEPLPDPSLVQPAVHSVGTPRVVVSPSPGNALGGATLSLRPPTPTPAAAPKAHPLVSEEEPPMVIR